MLTQEDVSFPCKCGVAIRRDCHRFSPVACQDRVIWINESSRNQKLIPLGTLVAASCASSFPANRLPRSPAVPEKVTGSGKQTCFSPWKGSPRSRGLVEFVSPFSYPQDLCSQV